MERKRALGGQKEKGSREGVRGERNRAQSGQKEKESREGLRWKETEH